MKSNAGAAASGGDAAKDGGDDAESPKKLAAKKNVAQNKTPSKPALFSDHHKGCALK